MQQQNKCSSLQINNKIVLPLEKQAAQSGRFQKKAFYLGIKIKKILYSQKSILQTITDRLDCNSLKSTKSTSIQQPIKQINKNNDKSYILFLQAFDTAENSQITEKITDAILIGTVYEKLPHFSPSGNKVSVITSLPQSDKVSVVTSSPQSNIYQIQPKKELAQMQIRSTNQINYFVKDFYPNQIRDIKIQVGMQWQQNQIAEVGECIIDPNIFISIFLDDNVNCIKDYKKVTRQCQNQQENYGGDDSKDIENKDRNKGNTDQDSKGNNIEVNANKNDKDSNEDQIYLQYEVYIANNRADLQYYMASNQKGIKIIQFKQHMKKLLLAKQIKENNHSQNQATFLNQSQAPPKQIKSSTLKNYLTYLRNNVENQLIHKNPQQHILENDIKKKIKESKSRKIKSYFQSLSKKNEEMKNMLRNGKEQFYPERDNENHRQQIFIDQLTQ